MFQIIIFDAEKLNEFFDSVASGFQKSPLEFILFAVLFGLLFLALLLFIISQIRNRRKTLKRSRERFQNIIIKRGLTTQETTFVEKMARYFPRDKKYLSDILTHAHTFTTCARLMAEKEGIDDEQVAKIRIKLGLSSESHGGGRERSHQLHSTAEFVTGIYVKLNLQKAGTVKGRIDAIDEEGLTIITKAEAGSGDSILLEVDSRSGYYMVRTHVIESGDNRLKVAHSEHLERVQNRNYYRKPLHLPAVLKVPGSAGKTYHTYLLDLGGGGAKVKNPGIKAFRGMELILLMKLKPDEPLVLQTRVARVSEKDASLSLAFVSIKEAVRDKIMRVVLH
ncbi:MAG: PilZ domain-containing protein [Spirochaetales bacterium]|nr:PilZ domain-containing protein [Spirochaetales bacterium]